MSPSRHHQFGDGARCSHDNERQRGTESKVPISFIFRLLLLLDQSRPLFASSFRLPSRRHIVTHRLQRPYYLNVGAVRNCVSEELGFQSCTGHWICSPSRASCLFVTLFDEVARQLTAPYQFLELVQVAKLSLQTLVWHRLRLEAS